MERSDKALSVPVILGRSDYTWHQVPVNGQVRNNKDPDVHDSRRDELKAAVKRYKQ